MSPERLPRPHPVLQPDAEAVLVPPNNSNSQFERYRWPNNGGLHNRM